MINRDPKWWHFWNPYTGFWGGFVTVLVFLGLPMLIIIKILGIV